MAPGTQRDHGWFYFGTGERRPVQMGLTESAIDAMSYCALQHGDRSPASPDSYRELYVSTDGAGGLPHALMDRVLDHGGVVRVAFDRDAAGERLWQAVRAEYAGAERDARLWRHLPAAGMKDWNEMLVARLRERESPNHGR